jgi:hypothetical protein
MTYREECDLKVIFIENWPLIAEAYARGLPMVFRGEQLASIEAITKAEMLDGLRLDAMWRKAIDEVSGTLLGDIRVPTPTPHRQVPAGGKSFRNRQSESRARKRWR